MSRRLLYGVPLALFLGLAVYLGLGLGRDPAALPSALLDRPPPDFVLAGLDGGPGLATGDLAGGPALVNFFASWCVPCRAEHPQLMALARAGRVPVYGIAYKDRPEDSRRFLAELGDPYRRIGTDRDGRVAIDWGVYGVPETFVLDRAGRIRHRHVGPMTPEVFQREIAPLLQQLERS